VTPDCDADDVVVPDDLVAALRRAADAVPAADLHPSGPKVRHASRRRHRVTAAAALTSAAVLVAAVLVGQAARRPASPPDVAVADQPTTTGGAAALDGGELLPGPHEPVLLPQANAELLPDGTTRELPRARSEDAPRGSAVRLPDGRLVTLASRDPLPGARQEDGSTVEGLAFVLAVFDADGNLLGERDIRRAGEQVAIAGVLDDQVVLVRSAGDAGGSAPGVRVSTIDPDSFEEERVADLDRLPGVAAAAGGRLVLVDGPAPECHITVVDLETGEPGQVIMLPCIGLTTVSISPDGSLAAVVVERRAGITASAAVSRKDILDQAVVFVSLDDGEVVGSWRFDISQGCTMVAGRDCPSPHNPVEYRGLGWVDDDHVDLVVQDPDPNADPRDIDLGRFVPERLRTIAVEIGGG
jgi:hypothetical protein